MTSIFIHSIIRITVPSLTTHFRLRQLSAYVIANFDFDRRIIGTADEETINCKLLDLFQFLLEIVPNLFLLFAFLPSLLTQLTQLDAYSCFCASEIMRLLLNSSCSSHSSICLNGLLNLSL